MQHSKRGVIVACLMSAMVVTACGGDDESGSADSGGGAKDVKSVTIGFAQRTSDAPYYAAMQKEAESLAKSKGFKLVFQDGGGDPVKQIDSARAMVSQGVDALIVNAVSADTEKTQMTAIAKQVPLMFIDTPIPDVGFTAVQSDNVKIGQGAGKIVAGRVGEGKTIKLAVLNGGPADVDVGPSRRKGFLAGLEEGGVKYDIVAEATANYTQEEAVGKTEDMLAAQPDIDVVFGYNDAMALGALSVVKRKGNAEVLVAGVDGQKEALAAIDQDGCDGQYAATGLNSPALATRDSVQIALDVATGKAKPDSYPEFKYTKAAGIGCENIGDFYDPASAF